MSLSTLYQQPLSDLGDRLGEAYRGIFSPLYDDALLDQFLTPQFTTESDWYVEHCEHSEQTGRLLQRCFERAGFSMSLPQGSYLLDIGSGSGNSIFPLLDSFPDHTLVASDLSPQMLLALKKSLSLRKCSQPIHLLQLNAENLDFKPESFELVVGMAILHHLHNPARAIAGAANILKSGGLAIFSEPFENGNYLLSLAYRMILRDAAAKQLSQPVREFLTGRIKSIALHSGLEKTEEFLHSHDDKWLFTHKIIEKVARHSGFSECIIMPQAQKPDALTRKTRVLLKYLNLDDSDLPVWAWEVISEVESGMSSLLREEMPLEAAIILRK